MTAASPPERRGAGALGGRDPFAALLAAAAEMRVEDAVAARGRARALDQQAGEDATLAGVLVDLAEHQAAVAVTTTTGRRQVGVLRHVGGDHLLLTVAGGAQVLVVLAAVASIRPGPGTVTVRGDRGVRATDRLADALAERAAERPAVVVGTTGDEVRGVLRQAGRDVLTVRVGDSTFSDVYVALAAVTDIRVG